jgi:hypothetical protein
VARATITVKNTGGRAGADVPQLYIAAPASTGEPPKQLKGFNRVSLKAGQSQPVTFQIDQRALSYWSTAANAWRVAAGCYQVMIGHNAGDVSNRATIAVNGAACRGAVASIVIPSETRCNAPSGRLSAGRLGPVRIGERRSSARRAFRRVSRRTRNGMDVFCLAGGPGIRVAYASRRLAQTASRRAQAGVLNRVILILTANRHYSLRGVKPGATLRRARRALKLQPPLRIGKNTWYLTSSGRGRGILKVQRGRVREVGVADRRFTGGRAAANAFLHSFR